jgi:hypothetical protein
VIVTRRARLAAAAICLLVALLGAPSAGAADPTLFVRYTMNCTFTIVGDNGATISAIPPGNYQVLITSPLPFAEPDLTGVPDPNYACGHSLSFRLTGPGVSLYTTLEDGDAAADHFTATFQLGGTYVAQEDRQPSVTRWMITASNSAAGTGGGGVGSGPTVTGGKPSPPVPISKRFQGWLNAQVSTTGKLTLVFRGKTVKSLKAGRYTFSVVDRASKGRFTLQKSGKPAVTLTKVPFVGSKSVTVALTQGRWMFYSSPTKKQFFTVA